MAGDSEGLCDSNLSGVKYARTHTDAVTLFTDTHTER